ncbi:MAG TPA: hypothetical protein VNH44_18710 [Micropepsaceae bacterium]|nr:hypothetical protein [Micropepsaceae bacterium]
MRRFHFVFWALALCLASAGAGAGAQTSATAASVAAPAAAPKPDSATIDLTQGYARIFFTFGQPAPVAASVADGVLTLRLGRAITNNIDTLTESLSPYVATGRRDRDGLTYSFALKGPVALHTSTQGNQTAVDLVPDSFKGVPPDLPPPPPPEVKKEALDLTKLPNIKMRIGEYSDHTRVVFDWPTPVVYTVYPGQGRISVRFEAPAKPDFSVLQTRSPAWVKSAGWHLDGSATVVDLETDAESTFKDFRDGAKVVIDVMAPKTDASVAGVRPPAPAPVPPGPPPKGSDAAAALKAGKAAIAVPSPALATPVMMETANPSAEMTRDGAALHFPAARGHAVAAFIRGETLWIVLDGHPAVDAATLLAPLASIIVKAESEQSGGAAVLKLVFKQPLLPSVEESEAALNVRLTSGAASPAEPLNFTRQGADGQTTLTTPLPGAVHVIQLADVQAGDHLFVIPARPGKGVLTPKRFVEMEALPTAAGVSIIPFTDDLSINVQGELVTVSRPKGLALSAASGATTEPVVQLLTSKQGPAFIDFAQWAKAGTEDVLATERNLRAAVARLPESEGNKARLNLARYLLARNLAPEALGEIQIIQAVDAKLANDPGISAMKGAAQYMMGRYADAKASLSGSALGADPHAALWRGMAEAKLGDFANARHDLAVSQTVLRFYPDTWQTRARLARAETGLAQGDLASANDALDQLSPQLSPRESVESRLYAAQLLAAQGHINESISRLRTLEQTDYAPIAAKATYARVDIELGAKKTKSADAIKALETLRYRWRGDDLELKTLRKLGSIYFAQESWREGLTVLRIAALNFPNAELARSAQDDMRRAFADLFLAGKADKMRPVDALALFYDFIELTPIGQEGDQMIRNLSDRLVTVDLLGPAEQLLDHQVKERLEGVARAQVATRLATIYLLDHKPKEALAIINDTRQTRLPDEVNSGRRLLEARALAGLKQYEAAIDLIADDESEAAGRLRADIAWDSGDWKIAGAKAEEVLGDRYDASGALLPEERALIMRAAVAYSLGGNEAALDKLRGHYGDKMKTSPDAKAFAIVSENIDRQGVAFRDLAKQIASVDTLQAFMADFKKQGAAKTASN